MRILVHEFVSGGGMAGQTLLPSLAAEGLAMRRALVADLAAIPGHEIVTTIDARFPRSAPRRVEVVRLDARGGDETFDRLVDAVDAVWLIAPETNRCLEYLAARVERRGKVLLGSSAAAIRLASDKTRLPALLARHGVAHPRTYVLRSGSSASAAARKVEYPVVVKPGRGAGCAGVSLARDQGELTAAVETARANGGGSIVLQSRVAGVAASVSLVSDGCRALPLTVNEQAIRGSRPFTYRGGVTPLDHPLAERAIDAAVRTCSAVPGLRGYVGVDVVLSSTGAVVIEVNPRVTTAYLGVRAAVEGNIAALTLAACAGVLPQSVSVSRRVRFTGNGRIVSNRAHSRGLGRA